MNENKDCEIIAGIDIGSTTAKAVFIKQNTSDIVYSEYRRHNASQLQCVCDILECFRKRFPGTRIRPVMTGSGAEPSAKAAGIPFIQEVVANSIAVCHTYDNAGTAIELGGQDAKIIFFKKTDKADSRPEVDDMRMNGSCTGGTGAFLDEVAAILKIQPGKLNELAEAGKRVYDIGQMKDT